MPHSEAHRPKRVLLDLGALAVIAVALAGIHFLLPPATQLRLALEHDAVSFSALFTSAYVHADDAHLYGNLLGFALASLYAYALCLYAEECRWFRHTALVLLVALPVLVNLAEVVFVAYAFPGSNYHSRGFSGVVAGFGGFLLVALRVYLAERYDGDLASSVGAALFFLLLLEIDVIYAGDVRPLVGGLVLLGTLLTLGGYVYQRGVEPPSWKGSPAAVGRDIVAVAFVSAVLVSLVFALFPAEVASGGEMTNIFAHGVGFGLGIVVALGVRGVENRPNRARESGNRRRAR